MVDVLVVNKHEAELLGRQLVASPDDLGAVLNRRGTALIVTLGPKGAAIHVDGTQVNIPGFPVDAVDTTGAGDTFCGVLATELAASGTLRLGVAALEHAVRYGCAAAALAVQAHGAVTSIPDRADIDAFLDKHVPPSVER
jgi:ribokinase